MRQTGDVLMSLGVTAVGIGAVGMALQWPYKAALYPLAIGIPVIIMGIAQLILSLLGKGKTAEKLTSMTIDASEDVDTTLVSRKDFLTFLWILVFFLLVFLFGFTIAGPLIVLLYLKIQSKEGWVTTLLSTASILVFFYSLFIWIMQVQFPDGWVIEMLKTLWSE